MAEPKEQTCPKCGGKGTFHKYNYWENPCKCCGGSGYVMVERPVRRCQQCKGIGLIPIVNATCVQCRGKGFFF